MSLLKSIDLNGDGCVSELECLSVFRRSGMVDGDPRFSQVYENLKKFSNTTIPFGFDDLQKIFGSNAQLISRIFRGELIVPDFKSFEDKLKKLFEETGLNTSGNVANYIPELAKAPPEKFGAAVCTVDGQRCGFGDSNEPFTIQSISKAISYCIALEHHGIDFVHKHVGREPSGLGFNELTLDEKGLPHNPMINAGAIMTCSLIEPSKSVDQRIDYISSVWKNLCSNSEVVVNNDIYKSESKTAHRNRALAHYMMEKKAFPELADIEDTLSLYFKCCSLELSCEQLSVVAATLASGGVSPISNKRLFSAETVKSCLSLMTSCGMYDFSGEWAFRIGLPAKSGVAGGLMVIVPNVLGLCVWSPRLDKHGNSVRGVELTSRIIDHFALHQFDNIASFQSKHNPLVMSSQMFAETITALIQASEKGDLVSVERIIGNGTDVNSQDYDLNTAMHLAARMGNAKVVDYLIRIGANIDIKNLWNKTPLDEALGSKSNECVLRILNDSTVSDRERKIEKFKYCLNSVSNLSKEEAGFLWAAWAGNIDSLSKYIARGVDINASDYNRRTALHIASSCNHNDVVSYLIAHGADVNLEDIYGDKAI